MTKYSLETKLAAVEAYINGVESLRDIAQKYNVGVIMLQVWVTKFRKHGIDAFQNKYTRYSIGCGP
ncbi:transposase [Bacillus sp. CGMCC 1.16607]|uniref:transposase n=1 Tax=Bacillus sp. CGMCC 1.16607 TaxID=3351842 RepID=UPI00363FCB94